MLNLTIQGMSDGKRELVLVCDSADIEAPFEEFTGPITVALNVEKIGRRISVRGTAECDAMLTCDYSLQEYREHIQADLALQFVIDTDLYLERKDAATDENEIRALHEDQKAIDLREDVRQELLIRLPLKRIAPEYRDKNPEDLIDKRFLDSAHPEMGSALETWEALKNFKVDDN